MARKASPLASSIPLALFLLLLAGSFASLEAATPRAGKPSSTEAFRPWPKD